MRVLALIPFFGGNSAQAPSKIENRKEYLIKTINSIPKDWDITIGVQNDEDYFFITKNIVSNVEYFHGCEGKDLPKLLFSCNKGKDYDYFYCTEADQVLHIDETVFDYVKNYKYLVPHRLEQLSPKGYGKDRTSILNGIIVPLNGKEYLIFNGTPCGDGVYKPGDRLKGYGGAFLCTKELFDKIVFRTPNDLIIEHATGLDAFDCGMCFKTSDWTKFFVEHLSGYEYHCKLEVEHENHSG